MEGSVSCLLASWVSGNDVASQLGLDLRAGLLNVRH